MKESLLRETENLKKAWSSKTPEKLRTYLVSGIQDPRSNIQSILTRHFLVRQLFGSQFEQLQEQELLHAMRLNTDRVDKRPTSEEEKNDFQGRWRAALSRAEAPRLSVLEAACGSANDYRFLDSYGIASFLKYSGFDLSESNIANAREMFPGVDFQCGSVFEIPRPPQSVDFVIAFDLFEHLSLEGLEAAIQELCRVSRGGLVLNFFNVSDIADHISHPVPERRYHWNMLSLNKIIASLAEKSQAMEVVHIHGMLSAKFGTHGIFDSFLNDLNQDLFTFYLKK